MQSLTNISLKTIVKKQVKWKAKLYISALSSLVILQIIFGILLSSSGSSTTHGRENLVVQFSIYSLDMFLIVSVFWAFIVAILFTTKAHRIDDLSVISSRASSTIANIVVMIIYSFIAVIIMISTYYLQVLGIILVEKESFVIENLFISPSILLLCFSSICLFGAIGLLLGTSFKGPVVIKIVVSTFMLLGFILIFMSPDFINLRPLIMLPNLMISVLYLLVALLCFSLTIWIADKSEVSRK